MNIYLLPLLNTPQTFTITMGDTVYDVTSKFNSSEDAGWVMDISVNATSLALASNIPLITGADLLSGLEYLGISGKLLVYTDGDDTAVPTLDNLGVESNVYFFTDNNL